MTDLFIKSQSNSVHSINIKKAEQHYNAKFIGDFTIKNKNNQWTEMPVAVFYQSNPNPEHKEYFGLYVTNGKCFICDATSAFSVPITAAVAENNQVIYSGYRHDYQQSDDSTVFIDGGRDYTRTNASNLVELGILKDKLVVI